MQYYLLSQFIIRSIYIAPKSVSKDAQCALKTQDTIGNCQRPVFLLGVIQHMHKIKTCENLSPLVVEDARKIMKEETPLTHEVVCFQMLDFETSKNV